MIYQVLEQYLSGTTRLLIRVQSLVWAESDLQKTTVLRFSPTNVYLSLIWSSYFPGLTPDESHISPIDNLDGGGRLYSYLSGSEGDVETDQAASPPQRPGGHQPHPSAPEHVGTYPRQSHPSHHRASSRQHRRRSRSPHSLPSSRSSSCSLSDREMHTTNTMDSSGTGENVYSRINETGKFFILGMMKR